MSKDVKNCVEGEMVKIVTQLGPHEPKLRAYRWNNMALVINADKSVGLEDMVLGSVCETASYWFDDNQELTLEGFINGMVNDSELTAYLVKDDYKVGQVLPKSNASRLFINGAEYCSKKDGTWFITDEEVMKSTTAQAVVLQLLSFEWLPEGYYEVLQQAMTDAGLNPLGL